MMSQETRTVWRTLLVVAQLVLLTPAVVGTATAQGPIATESGDGPASRPFWPIDSMAAETRARSTLGPDSCSDCHALEISAWKASRHSMGYKQLSGTAAAKDILKRMGLLEGFSQRSVRARGENLCAECHYTSMKTRKPKPIAGVSCESCHQPARSWIGLHDKVGADPEGKSIRWGEKTNRAEPDCTIRRSKAAVSGMVHSGMTYEIARNCYSCHAVPNEQLINVGNHKAGSDFELVEWSQGEVRHNFSSSDGAPRNPTNQLAPLERRRQFYVVGALVNLEISLRYLGDVRQAGGVYHLAMIRRVNQARIKVIAVLEATEGHDPAQNLRAELAKILDEVPAPVDTSIRIDPDLAGMVRAVARQAADLTRDLAGIDQHLPGSYKGNAFTGPP